MSELAKSVYVNWVTVNLDDPLVNIVLLIHAYGNKLIVNCLEMHYAYVVNHKFDISIIIFEMMYAWTCPVNISRDHVKK